LSFGQDQATQMENVTVSEAQGQRDARSPGRLGSSVPAVRVDGVVKRFGATVALDGAGLEVGAGMVFGLLGPNGAGKTTLVRILATLLAPDAGRAEVLGHDVAREPAAVRELIGLTGQFGPGTLTFGHAAVHEIDSSWEVFRLLAIGVVRLLGLPSDGRIPMDLLPRFGGSVPASPGAD
jgi:ABC-type molybdenum transport system ATPase subunit/photorepair protein PhrA